MIFHTVIFINYPKKGKQTRNKCLFAIYLLSFFLNNYVIAAMQITLLNNSTMLKLATYFTQFAQSKRIRYYTPCTVT